MTDLPTTPDNVVEYIASLEGDALQMATQFRELILRAAPEVTETIRYKMPCFLVDGQYLVYFGAWKNHIGLYPVPPLAIDLEREVGPYRAAKDTVRFRYRDAVPWDIVERLIAELVRRLGDNG